MTTGRIAEVTKERSTMRESILRRVRSGRAGVDLGRSAMTLWRNIDDNRR